MSTVDQIMTEIERLPAEEQSELLRQITRKILAKKFEARADQADTPLPVTDAELDQIVHEARRETLRAHGL